MKKSRFVSSKEIARIVNENGRGKLYRETLRANIGETSLVPLINEQGEKEKDRDEREFFWCGSFFWGFGWCGTERRRA